jgi:hypothetical protein
LFTADDNKHFHEAAWRILIYLFTNIVIVFFIYAAGNFQDFLDSTQFFMLNILSSLTLGFVLLSINYFILFFLCCRTYPLNRRYRIILNIFYALISLTLYILVKTLLVWIEG